MTLICRYEESGRGKRGKGEREKRGCFIFFVMRDSAAVSTEVERTEEEGGKIPLRSVNLRGGWQTYVMNKSAVTSTKQRLV